MKVPAINSYSNKTYYNLHNVSLRSNHDSNKQIQKKREYLDTKTDGLYGFGTILLVLGLLLDGVNNSMSKERTTKQKIGLGFLIASMFVCALAIIKQINLSLKYKEGEKENDK